MGGDHLRGDNRDRSDRGGDLARRRGLASGTGRDAGPVPELHPVRGHPDPGPDSHPQGLAEPDPDPGADGHPVADTVQPGAGELPDAATAAHGHAQPNAVTDGIGQPVADRRPHSDSGADRHAHPDAATELDPAADGHPDTALAASDPDPVRARRAAGCRSRP